MRSLFKIWLFVWLAAACSQAGTNWPSFRGENASGVADGFKLPTSWNLETKENVKWKAPVPGLGHAAPVIWENQVFILTAVGENDKAELRVGLYGDIAPVESEGVPHEWLLLSFDKKTGRELWRKQVVKKVPSVKRHPKSSHANSTPATDGKRVAVLAGAEGLFCFDLSGKLLWQKDLGYLDSGFFRVPTAQWGFASSPILVDGKVVVQCDIQTNSFIAAFAAEDGKELWKTARREVPTWSTPTIYTGDGRKRIAVNGWKEIAGYDLLTGERVWLLKGGGDIPVPAPVVEDDLIFITNAHGTMAPIYAIRASAAGDISLGQNETNNQFIAWSVPRRGNYMQTPLAAGGWLYCCNDAGVLSCYESKTGQLRYSERLGTGRTGFTASAVSGDGKIYLTSEQGNVFVAAQGSEFKLLAQNELQDLCMATPALSAGTIFFRTRSQLIAIGE